MRRVLPLAWVAVVVAGSSCVDLTRPKADGGGGRDGGADEPTLSDGGVNDGDEEPIADALPEASVEGGRDTGADAEVCPTLSNGLVGYWKLDESSSSGVAADSSGMGNDGQIMGSPGRVTSGLPPLSFSDPRAFSFAGQSDTDDGISIPDSASLRPAAISIALWVKFASLMASSTCGAADSQSQYIVERRNSRGSQGKFEAVALIKQADGTITFLLSSDDGLQAFATSKTGLTTADVGKWFHIVGTYDGSTQMQMFVNGVLERTIPYTTPIAYDPSWPFFIGRTGECPNGAAWDARLKGTLDDVRVYNRALTACEVARLAAGGD